ncbi:hypothetical protein CHARACLAT_007443 [Characodon lateralis]|uniref:Uncharacterized protein n=1 Tax=Characodon lateralis TaxID=208331 RepID=A0ABU7E7V0_9TELE|nr:hypothetical protein [Characodon lateralis]
MTSLLDLILPVCPLFCLLLFPFLSVSRGPAEGNLLPHLGLVAWLPTALSLLLANKQRARDVCGCSSS